MIMYPKISDAQRGRKGRARLDTKEPADHGAARAELDRAVRTADAAYHAEVARMGLSMA
jgi:hypothetical protein